MYEVNERSTMLLRVAFFDEDDVAVVPNFRSPLEHLEGRDGAQIASIQVYRVERIDCYGALRTTTATDVRVRQIRSFERARCALAPCLQRLTTPGGEEDNASIRQIAPVKVVVLASRNLADS